MKYRTKPCEIEAVKWTGVNLEEIKEFVGESLIYDIIDTAWEVGKGRPHVIIKIKHLREKCWRATVIILLKDYVANSIHASRTCFIKSMN